MSTYKNPSHRASIVRHCSFIDDGKKCGRKFIDKTGRTKVCPEHQEPARIKRMIARNRSASLSVLAFGR